MDKRTEENLRVKRLMVNAFFTLLEENDLESISISEITRIAKVSRMAYYRNFDSKIDIIDFYLDDILDEQLATLNHDINFWAEEFGRAFFQSMGKHKERILLLNRIGLDGMVLNKFSVVNENLAGDMPQNSIERYNLYYAAGAAYNGTIEWLKGGCRESIEEMTQSLGKFMKFYVPK